MKQLFTLLYLLMAFTVFAQRPPTAPIVAKALVAHRDTTTEADTSKENKDHDIIIYRSIQMSLSTLKVDLLNGSLLLLSLGGLTVFSISGWLPVIRIH
jgi:hypothetical protein